MRPHISKRFQFGKGTIVRIFDFKAYLISRSNKFGCFMIYETSATRTLIVRVRYGNVFESKIPFFHRSDVHLETDTSDYDTLRQISLLGIPPCAMLQYVSSTRSKKKTVACSITAISIRRNKGGESTVKGIDK